MEIKGLIHSTESFGAADGPGVRFVVFLQGCNMRCRYCHNPDSWSLKGDSSCTEMTAAQVLEKALRYRSYWKDNGGITVSGGEPLLQIEFLTELFGLAKNEGVNTCLDTAGQPFTREQPFFSQFNKLMKYTDLVMLDIKEINLRRHTEITSHGNENILDMARYLAEINKPVWIRYVLVPGLSDFDEDIEKLAEFLKPLKNVERVEVLPYHTLGKFKWEQLGMNYPLGGTKPPSEERVRNAQQKFNSIFG